MPMDQIVEVAILLRFCSTSMDVLDLYLHLADPIVLIPGLLTLNDIIYLVGSSTNIIKILWFIQFCTSLV